MKRLLLLLVLGITTAFAHRLDNQTLTLTPILPGSTLPFTVSIKQASFLLPEGIHSGALAVFHGKWILFAGRTNGLHGFGPGPFPPDKQNTSIFVVDPSTGNVSTRSLTDPGSGLTQQQIDTLSVTSPQSYQEGSTLYMTGGYGIDTNQGTFGTKPVLTAIYLPGIINWVTHPNDSHLSVSQNIRQLYNPIFQITGGRMYKLGTLTHLVFGQNFTGVYTPGSDGVYSQQVRLFKITSNGNNLAVQIYPSKPAVPDPNFRRRDLNIVPTLLNNQNQLQYGLVAYAGVFTPTTGVWTVPVVISENSDPVMADASATSTFKQGMNHYISATASLYSRQSMNMYHIFFGGASYGYYSGGVFQTDAEVPFINQVTTVQMDTNGNFSQYIMDAEYPVILSTQSNPGNVLLFGAGASFIPSEIHRYSNLVLSLDSIREPTVIGYIVGGIESTLANTNTMSDSAASPYVFTVTLTPK